MNSKPELADHVERYTYKSTCPVCGKFLTRSMVRITRVGISEVDFNKYMTMIKITFGAQTMCRRCRKVRQTEKELHVGEPVESNL